jgi:uncharacterized protein
MIIDMHAHIGDLRTVDEPDHMPITIDNLIERLDEEGIDKAVVLPWPMSPEGITFPGMFGPLPDVVSQVKTTLTRPDRLIAFGNADARWGGNHAGADFSWLLERFIEMGCRGMGEVAGYLYFDDPRVVNLFRQCGGHGLPVTIESCNPGDGRYGLIDVAGSPHLERLLRATPGTTVIGHGPGFWADISSDNTGLEVYPQGPVPSEGGICRLMRDLPNLYADLSAGSGWFAISRDREFGVRFLNDFQDKLMFGTDVCFAEPAARTETLGWLRSLRASGSLSQEAYDKITHGNALRVLGLG